MKLKFSIFQTTLILIHVSLYLTMINNTGSSDRFYLSEKEFILNGSPFQIISGEMHYLRIPRQAWRDRLKMAKAMGLNTISVYTFWNVHQPQKDTFDFTGNNDIAKFIYTAKEEGLYVILRPSPYVCAEWEFGGYPYWLQNEKDLEVRSKNENYLSLYRNYIQKVAEQIAQFQIHRNEDGNILMVQVENEYGSYGSDKEYLKINKDIFNEAGFDGVLFTCDPIEAIKNGHLEGLLPAINGQDDPETVFRMIKENNNGKGPFMIAEWYPAWFDSWGKDHNTKPADEFAKKLDDVLKAGISINMYMFHGGTTTGFRNGANFNLYMTGYEPQITSYDYDAPLDEAGNPTEKYFKFREVIKKYLPKNYVLPDVPDKKEAKVIDHFSFSQTIDLLSSLNQFQAYEGLLTFEDINLDYGYVVYETWMNLSKPHNLMNLSGIRDYAMVFVDGNKVGTFDRRQGYSDASLNISSTVGKQKASGTVKFQILVENLGRINFGPELLKNKKGIIGFVKLNGEMLTNWTTYKVSLDKLSNIAFLQKVKKPKYKNSFETNPVVLKGYFNMETLADSYLDFSQWGKGSVWINGNNLGRYWYIGPQQTLYVPKEWLNAGRNELVIFEMSKIHPENLKGLSHPILDKLQ